MAASSKYIQLSSSVLMEYIYSDQEAINTPGNQYRISTDTAPIWKLSNEHNKKDQILNADNSAFIVDGQPIGTGNVRNRSFAIIDPYRSALLSINKLVFYNDYDSLLTDSSSLPIVFTQSQSPVYDTIKLHLVQGFNFENNDGLVLSVKCKKKSGDQLILANLIYNKNDVWETLNPSPFFFGGKVYSTYLEIRVLSTYNLIIDYWISTLTGDTVVERITDGDGVQRDQQITIDFAFIEKREIIDEQEYVNLVDTKTVDLRVRDQFETISAFITESTSGDYIEYYAKHDGNIIENYINALNNSGGDYIILHDLSIFEWVFNPDTQDYFWLKTDDIETIQVSDFERSNFFRPIIRNSSAIAFKINYTVRLYNREDNSQVWKTASLVSSNAAKYGRSIKRINLGENPIQTKIYNQRVIKDVKINRINPPVVNNTKYITSLSNNSNISITNETINFLNDSASISSLQSTNTSDLQIYSNGLAKIVIPESTVFLKFNVFQKVSGSNRALNLSGLGSVIISFTSDQGENLEFTEYPNEFTTSASGEIVFRISEENAKTILRFNNRTFKLYLKNESGDKTHLYTGEFLDTMQYIEKQKNDRIVLLENQINELSQQLITLSDLSQTQQDTVSKLVTENQKLNSTLLNNLSDSELISTQQEINSRYSNVIEDLKSSIFDLSAKLKTQLNELSIQNGLTQFDLNFSLKESQSENEIQDLLNKNKASIKNDTATNM